MLLKKNKIEDEVEYIIPLDEYSAIFDKLDTKEKLSFEKLKEQINTTDVGVSGQFSMILLLLFTALGSSALYLFSITKLGMFSINGLLSFILLLGTFGVFYSSTVLVAKFFHAKKIFKYQRADIINKKFYEKFLNCDTDNLVSDLKNTLSTRLENTEIQKYNPAVYDYIYHGINNIQGDFSKLKYNVEQNLRRETYSFAPFYEFFKEINTISEIIDNAKDIKVINE